MMKCGAKCFLVELEVYGELKTKSVITRTPISARKTIQKVYENKANILTVRRKK